MNKQASLLILAILAIILVGLGAVAFVLSVPGLANSSSPAAPVSLTSGAVVSLDISRMRAFSGVIQKIGDTTFTLTLTSEKKTITVAVDPMTNYDSSTGVSTFKSLKVGQQIEVRGHFNVQEQVLTAIRILSLHSSGNSYGA